MNKLFLELGSQPLANNYLSKFKIKQIKYNLKLFFNTKTKMVSISKRIPSKLMFTNNYPYRSSMSKTMQNSFYSLSLEIKKRFKPKMILEIGSNDGALIKNFDKREAIGVEPCNNLAQITKKMGWCDDVTSKFYNKEIKVNNNIRHEKLFKKNNTYDCFIVINYNTKKIKPRIGSAIFLHLTKTYKKTAGCIAVKKKDLLIILKLIKKNSKIKIY